MDRPEPPLELPPPEEHAPLRVAAEQEQPPAPPVGTVRLLFTVAVTFTIIFLFLRTATVEPFGVPTGSMAPALIGNHRECPCPRCGYPVRVGVPARGDAVKPFTDVACPNCGKHIALTSSREINGDRLLVDKNIFSLRSPRRWEVAVFRCAADLSKPYVKRVVGLPGEAITIADGDVYANGELLRKSLVEVRETRVVVFDMAYVPNTGGWGERGLVEPPGAPRLPVVAKLPPPPADASVVSNSTITLDAAETSQKMVGVTYHHRDLDDARNGVPKPNSPAEYRKDIITSWNSYDGARPDIPPYPVHDFMVECDVEVAAVAGEGTFACRLFDGKDSVNADVSVGPRSKGTASLVHEGRGGLAAVSGVSLQKGKSYKFEFAFVDRRAALAIDGKQIAAADLPRAKDRGDVRKPLQFGARGCKLVVRNLKLYRDIHYTPSGRNAVRVPAILTSDEYFVLGDNSGNSQDSREWHKPGVPESDFIGKPFVIHQPLRLGRSTWGGQERVFQTLDWSRLRWLH